VLGFFVLFLLILAHIQGFGGVVVFHLGSLQQCQSSGHIGMEVSGLVFYKFIKAKVHLERENEHELKCTHG